MTTNFHTPVLLQETLDFLAVRPGGKYIDATVGGGGHTAAILEKGGEVLAIDADPDAVRFVRDRFAAELTGKHPKLKIVQGNFKNIEQLARGHEFGEVAGIIFDLGMSSWQIDGSGRGFSYLKNEPLDMRMGPALSVTAGDLLSGLTEKELNDLLFRFAEEKRSRAIARAIIRARTLRPFRSTRELSGLLAWVELRKPDDFWSWYGSTFTKSPGGFGSFDRRARVFQALRVVVNDELGSLKLALPRALSILAVGGRLVVLSFHSLEDRVVKIFGRETAAQGSSLAILTPKPLRAQEGELRENPRARSAMLRVFERKE